MTHRSDPEGKRLPIKLDSTSNGEFQPVPLDATNRAANRLAQEWAGENAKRRGLGRRGFMVSACGAASTLLAFNTTNAAAGRTGGYYELDQVAAVDPDARGGDYYGPRGFYEMRGLPKKVGTKPAARSEEDARRLWQVSEELTGIRFLSNASDH